MTVDIFCEGEDDAAVLKAILATVPGIPALRFYRSGGSTRLLASARSHLILSRNRMLVVGDADTDDEAKAKLREREMLSYLRWASPEADFSVLLFRPCLEVIFFQTEDIWKSLADPAGHSIDIDLDVARMSPKAILQRSHLTARSVIERASPIAKEALAASPALAPALAFIRSGV